MGRIIALVGPDASGKTSLANLLVDLLLKEGIKFRYRWMRFHHLLSLPLLGCARIVGLSESRTLRNGKSISLHHFYRSKFFSVAYSIALFVDTVLFTIAKIYFPLLVLRRNLICDRFTYDTIVDLMVSTGTSDFRDARITRAFLMLVPRNAEIVMLMADEEVLVRRRDDIIHDENLRTRLLIYKRIAEELGITIVDTHGPKQEVLRVLMRELALVDQE